VVETNYCITLDRVPEDLYPEIIANNDQREEWIKLLGINEIEGDTVTPAYSTSLPEEFLRANQYLVVDTRFFGDEFKDKLLASIEHIEDNINGLLIHSENFQAINFLSNRFQNSVDCIYIDPPYNTSENTFIYKNNYKHSSWISMMNDRISKGHTLLKKDGVFCNAIDDTETSVLRMILNDVFHSYNYVSTIAAEVNPAGQNLKPNAPALSHDYCQIYARNIDIMKMRLRELTEEEKNQYTERDDKGFYLWDNLRRRGGNSRPTDRPNQWFPLYANLEESKVSVGPFTNAEEIWPVDPKGERRIWRVNPDGAVRGIENGEISVIEKAGRCEIVKKTRMPIGKKPKTLWKEKSHSATTHGTKLLNNIMGSNTFSYPKSLYLVIDCIKYWADQDAIILDYFAGSGTTAHATIELNKIDEGNRKYILVEMGNHFGEAIIPRLKKLTYTDKWKNGKPTQAKGTSHLFKYIKLESYDDSLNNLELQKSQDQQELLESQDDFGESYKLSYMLDVESDGSNSHLNLDAFEDPFNYVMNISTGSAGETKSVKIDLVETFNYLIGLTVQYIDHIQGFRVIQGTNPKGDKVLIIWRNLKEKTNADLDEFFRKQEYNPRDMEFDLIYVNGDNNLENLRREDETWKVRLIEEDFKRLMFETEEV